MYAYIKGQLAELTPTHAVIESNGVGYFLQITLATFEKIQGQENCRLYTYLNVREDELSLYGFYTKTEKSTFELMITVSGIGPSTARTLLSTLPAEEFQSAILSGNISLLKSVKGIGAKTAQRMVLELQDKLAKGTNEVIEVTHPKNKNETKPWPLWLCLVSQNQWPKRLLLK